MKRIIITGAVAAIAAVSFAGTASAAAPSPERRLLRSDSQGRQRRRHGCLQSREDVGQGMNGTARCLAAAA